MAKRYPAPPKLLLAMISAIITAFTLVYGSNFGWLSVHMMYLYGFFIIYYLSICKGDRVACCYTIAGAVTSTVSLLAIKLLDAVLGAMITIITAYIVAFMTDIIVKCDWRYFSLGNFDLSSFPIESYIQFKFDQHVQVTDVPPVSAPETSNQESEPEKYKKKIEKSPLSRKEKKAEAKKQKRDKGAK